jgi:hypothetical protein
MPESGSIIPATILSGITATGATSNTVNSLSSPVNGQNVTY